MIYLIQSKNPETIFLEPLRIYLKDIDLSNIFPNYDTVRVGTVHPFAILLAQDVLGTSQQLNLFPSITIANTSSQEESVVVAYDVEDIEINKNNINNLNEEVTSKKWYVSTQVWNSVMTHFSEQNPSPLYGIQYSSRLEGQVDFNIWADNKEITSFLFDLVYQFVIHQRTVLKNKDIIISSISGRRSGDINLDFGRILYGSNIQANISTIYETIAINLELAEIKSAWVNVKGYSLS